jgi:DNA-binding transcriptional ArsR family regulator
MLNQSPIDECFRALAEPVRRAILERLSTGPTSVSELASPFDMTLAAVVQHVQALERCGLITTTKVGRSRICQVDPRGLDVISSWIDGRRAMVERQLDRLGDFLAAEDTRPAKASPQKGKHDD